MNTVMVLKPVTRNLVFDFLNNFTSIHTRDAYRVDLQDFFTFFQGQFTHPSDITITHLITYRDHLSQTKAPNTVQRKLSSVKSFLGWCVVNGLLQQNPATNLKLPKNAVKYPTLAFTDEEVRNILEIPDSSTFYGNSHKLILAFLFNLGLRRSELVNIKLEDIYEDRGTVVLRIKGKGSKVRCLPLNENVMVYFKAYLHSYAIHSSSILNQQDYLLQSSAEIKNEKPMDGSSIYRILNRYAKKAGITKRVGPHSARATAISHLLENQVSPRDVADFAGHTSISTTVGIYDKKRDGFKNSAAYKVNYKIS